jgi:hypothetical protein
MRPGIAELGEAFEFRGSVLSWVVVSERPALSAANRLNPAVDHCPGVYSRAWLVATPWIAAGPDVRGANDFPVLIPKVGTLSEALGEPGGRLMPMMPPSARLTARRDQAAVSS